MKMDFLFHVFIASFFFCAFESSQTAFFEDFFLLNFSAETKKTEKQEKQENYLIQVHKSEILVHKTIINYTSDGDEQSKIPAEAVQVQNKFKFVSTLLSRN